MSRFRNFLKNTDLFGKRVYLTHDGNETFNTWCGGVVSLVFYIALLIYGLVLASDVWTDRIKQIST